MRERELWERAEEAYPAATVLEDLLNVAGDVAAAQRIVARFTALRIVLLVLAGRHPPAVLDEERAIARSYVEVLPRGDDERIALGRMIAMSSARLRRSMAACALDAGELAAAADHDAGAYWLRYTAYLLALGAGWRVDALRAARAVLRTAHARGARRSERLWRQRVLALEAVEP